MVGPLLMVLSSSGLQGGLGADRLLDAPTVAGYRTNIGNLARLMDQGVSGQSIANMVATSLVVGFGVAVLTTTVALLAAYAMTFFNRTSTRVWFWLTLATLYFPIEARMLPTFDVAAKLGLVNTVTGMILPVLPLALATFIFRQFLKSMPPELLEAARLDGAGPLRFLRDFIVPLSLVPIGAVLIVTFLFGWNQYLWPLMISLDNSLFPLMRGLNLAGSGSGPSMVLASISVIPPLVLVVGFQRLISRAATMHV